LTLHQLKVFETVARYLSITKASKELHVSQPSVFQQVKFLEDSCGVKLYRKIGRGIELTREGQSFQTDVGDILLRIDKLRQKFVDTEFRARPSSVTIGGSHAVSVSILLSIIAAFKKSHPQVRVTLRTGSSPRIERFILNSEIEIGVVTNPSGSAALSVEPYRKERVVAFVAAGHPLAKKKQLTLADAAQVPLIIRRGRLTKTRQHLNQIEQKGFQLNILMECESAEAVKIATMKGMGMGIAYRDHIDSEIRKGELKILKILGLKPANAQSFVVYQKDRPLSPNAQDFLELLKRLH
jgi:LysR family hydrogen peroxide-inducible transcriptional activator